MRILGVGTATVDLINQVSHYPAEDEELRAVSQRRARGGNATNTLVVLSQLRHHCCWAGTLADDAGATMICQDLTRHAIDTGPAVICSATVSPTSYVTLSQATGSRTIIHHRQLPELSADEFAGIDLSAFDWIHFEGRNVAQLQQMIARTRRAGINCSLEVEKPRAGIEALLPLADLLLFSGDYARGRGFVPGDRFLMSLREAYHLSVPVTCSWGAQGAWGMQRDGKIFYQPAVQQTRLVDTLGAGDVFNAAMIDGLGSGDHGMPALLEAACRLAGGKCAQQGFDGLGSA